MGHDEKLIVALDVGGCDPAAALIDRLSPTVRWFKVGSTLFTREGPSVCRLVKEAGARLFLDLKFHDIPNTVYGAVRSAMDLGVDMLTLHASGGPAMLRRAVEAAADSDRPDVTLVAVTVLTHLSVSDFSAMFDCRRANDETVVALARVAKESGMTGVVASARELGAIKERLGEEFVVVTPGIRLPGSGADDQTRVVTPEVAVRDGADYIVVGRPIIDAPDPAAAARLVLDRMNAV